MMLFIYIMVRECAFLYDMLWNNRYIDQAYPCIIDSLPKVKGFAIEGTKLPPE